MISRSINQNSVLLSIEPCRIEEFISSYNFNFQRSKKLTDQESAHPMSESATKEQISNNIHKKQAKISSKAKESSENSSDGIIEESKDPRDFPSNSGQNLREELVHFVYMI